MQRERDREAARHDVPPVERSIEIHDITDALVLRIDILKRTKVDKVTPRDLDSTVRLLKDCLDSIKALQERNDTQARIIAEYKERDRARFED
jgi:hypothetical protein